MTGGMRGDRIVLSSDDDGCESTMNIETRESIHSFKYARYQVQKQLPKGGIFLKNIFRRNISLYLRGARLQTNVTCMGQHRAQETNLCTDFLHLS